MKTVLFQGFICTINFATYGNGRKAIQLMDADDGCPVATASINLRDVDMDDDEIAIKDYSENAGMFNVLSMAKVISDPVRFVSSGFVSVPICKILTKEKEK